MTNTQFYLGIAIPSILIILGWLHQNTRLTDLRVDVNRGFDRVDQQFDRVQKYFDKVDQRFEKVEAHLARIDQDLRLFYATDKEL